MNTIAVNQTGVDHFHVPSVDDVLLRLKKRYCPELRALYSDCNWLKSTLLIDGCRELQPNETKLLQFVSLIDSVIKEISSLHDDVSFHNVKDLLGLEMKIVRTILPVKARLHERWKQQIEQESKEKDQQFKPSDTTTGSPRSGSDTKKVSVAKRVGKRNDGSVSSQSSKTKRKHEETPYTQKNSKIVSLDSINTNQKHQDKIPDAQFPKGSLSVTRRMNGANAMIAPSSKVDEDGYYSQYFVIDHEDDPEVNENIFDNISDCGVDLLDEEDDRLELQNLGITSPESSSLSDSVSGKRRFQALSSSSTTTIPSIKKEKPPGPYYSSAVDLDLKSSFSSTIVTLKEEEYMSSRRRRRLNQIVPYPRKPRQADYSCSICSEDYQCTVNENPWWAVYKHECPHCKQFQIPRIDISTASNAIELDPNVIALYGEGIEDSGDDEGDDSEEYTDDEEVDGEIDEGLDEGRSSNADLTKIEDSFFDGEGLLAKDEASKLLILMCHARTCSGRHSSPKHEEICRSTKFLMLHIRDCKGMDGQGRECQFPWCKPSKKMLKHLSYCHQPDTCLICNPWALPEPFQQLRKLNQVQFSHEPHNTEFVVHTSNSLVSLA